MNWTERIEHYKKATGFPGSYYFEGATLSEPEGGKVIGLWIMGADYHVESGYHGGYPATYLRRVRALFPDKQNALHVFSGKVDTVAFPGKTVDITAALHPDYVDDAQTLGQVPLEEFDIVLADPPYTGEDCEHYGTTMVKRNLVMQSLGRRLRSGTHVVWLDQVLPMYRKDQFCVEAFIAMVKSTNHRFREVVVFRRL